MTIRNLLLALGLALSASSASAASMPTNLPPAQLLLDHVIAGLPDIPLQIDAQLQARDVDGRTQRKMNLEMLLDWQDNPPHARYTIRDPSGKSLKYLGVSWPGHGDAEYRFMQGDPLVAMPSPPLTDPVEGLDLTWNDLSMSFIWWKGGRTLGTEDVRSRNCFIVDVPAPSNAIGVASVRLWIDAKINMMLRAESLDAAGQKVRRMDVMGFRKINERWFISRIELQSFPSKHKTYLRVKSVYDRERKQFLNQESAGEAETVEPVAIPSAEVPAAAPSP